MVSYKRQPLKLRGGTTRRVGAKKCSTLNLCLRQLLGLSLMGSFYILFVANKNSKVQENSETLFYRISQIENENEFEEINDIKSPNNYNHLKSRQSLKQRFATFNNKKVSPIQNNTKKQPIILVWSAMEYQMRSYKQHLEYVQSQECGGCIVTTNRSLQEDCSALVHFNSKYLQYEMDVPDPNKRNPKQIYAFWSRETPFKTYSFHSALQNPRFDKIFNITMNYRLDSDIVDYFGNREYEIRLSQAREKKSKFENSIRNKNGLAIWAVSNCNSTFGARKRMEFAMKLINSGLNVDSFGACFHKRLKSPDLFKKYKFYLAFENSVHCPDYISEKFWRNSFRAGAVPIVWGPTKEDVDAIAPPHSYIHTDDYSNVVELINYINYLDQNDTAYMEYHLWRKLPINPKIADEDIQPNHRSTLCRLCKRVTSQTLKYKSIPSVHDWLYKTRYKDNLCLNEVI